MSITTDVGAIKTSKNRDEKTFIKVVPVDFKLDFSFTLLNPQVKPSNPITKPIVIHTLMKSDSG